MSIIVIHFQQITGNIVGVYLKTVFTNFPSKSWELGLAPFFSRSLATEAIPLIVSEGVTSGLNEADMCNGVSLSGNVEALTSALLSIKKRAAYSSPENRKNRK